MDVGTEEQRSGMSFFPGNREQAVDSIDGEILLEDLKRMLLIRNFEIRAESAYQQGKIGGFFHSYMGQEAIQTSILRTFGADNWFVASYRCHALALLLGATPNELMAELYGKVTGNALGRGGSMHFFTDRLLGGHGIVGGQIPIGIGAALSIKRLKNTEEVAIIFMGDGAVAQGAFHESLNLASLWDLPCLFVIENNQWGMGTAVSHAISVERLAEAHGPAYNVKAYTLDGMDYFNCHMGFSEIKKEILHKQRPVLVEVIAERFRGHSISDPGLYRSKEDLTCAMKRDPILLLRNVMEDKGYLKGDDFKTLDKVEKAKVIDAMKFAEESPLPELTSLEDDVLAP